jgi:hypothetical protein
MAIYSAIQKYGCRLRITPLYFHLRVEEGRPSSFSDLFLGEWPDCPSLGASNEHCFMCAFCEQEGWSGCSPLILLMTARCVSTEGLPGQLDGEVACYTD